MNDFFLPRLVAAIPLYNNTVPSFLSDYVSYNPQIVQDQKLRRHDKGWLILGFDTQLEIMNIPDFGLDEEGVIHGPAQKHIIWALAPIDSSDDWLASPFFSGDRFFPCSSEKNISASDRPPLELHLGVRDNRISLLNRNHDASFTWRDIQEEMEDSLIDEGIHPAKIEYSMVHQWKQMQTKALQRFQSQVHAISPRQTKAATVINDW